MIFATGVLSLTCLQSAPNWPGSAPMCGSLLLSFGTSSLGRMHGRCHENRGRVYVAARRANRCQRRPAPCRFQGHGMSRRHHHPYATRAVLRRRVSARRPVRTQSAHVPHRLLVLGVRFDSRCMGRACPRGRRSMDRHGVCRQGLAGAAGRSGPHDVSRASSWRTTSGAARRTLA